MRTYVIPIVLFCVCTALLVMLIVAMVGCGPRVDNTMGYYSATTAASAAKKEPLIPRRFSVNLPAGWREVSHVDYGEASEAKYENVATGTTMKVSLQLEPGGGDPLRRPSLTGALEAEGQRMIRRGWKVHSLDSDASDGMAAFVGYSPIRQSIARAMHPERCPPSTTCAAVFVGRWEKDRSREAHVECEWIQASFTLLY